MGKIDSNLSLKIINHTWSDITYKEMADHGLAELDNILSISPR